LFARQYGKFPRFFKKMRGNSNKKRKDFSFGFCLDPPKYPKKVDFLILARRDNEKE
jgi:hypothetical protein